MRRDRRSLGQVLRELRLPREERRAARAERRAESAVRRRRGGEWSAARRAAAVEAESRRDRNLWGGGR